MTSKRKLLIILITLSMTFNMIVHVSAYGAMEVTTNDHNVALKGKTDVAGDNVTLQVFRKEGNTRAYIDQAKTDGSGNFQFQFYTEYGEYKAVAVSSVNRYEAEFTVREPIIDKDNGSGSSRRSRSRGGSTGVSQSSAEVKLNPQMDKSTGAAKTSVTESKINEASAAAKPDSDGTKQIKLDIQKVEGASSYNVGIPGNLLSKNNGTEKILINTDICSINIASNMLGTAGANKDVSISMTKVDVKLLGEDLQKQIGNKPVLDIDILIDGKEISWKNDDSPVEISFVYTPTAEELKDPEHIVVWYIDSTGKAISVPSGRYDAKTGKVTFKTNHLSKYAVVYYKKTFDDIGKLKWAEKQIEVMASKGIIEGKTDNTFGPTEKITRGEYLSWMVKALGLSAKTDGNFADVKATDKWYAEIALAKKLGIAVGGGDNKYRPSDVVSRQDIMVLTDRALKITKHMKISDNQAELAKYKDAEQISEYAKASVANMVKEQIIRGSDNKLNPKGNMTRAEAAVLIYRLYNK